MALFKHTAAALAAAGLALAQPASAAPVRTGSPIAESEAAVPGKTLTIGLLTLIGVVFVIMALAQSGDPTEALPTSP